MVGQQPDKVKLQHSVKVPQFYKTAANIAKRASEEHRSLKDLVFNANKHLVSLAALSSLISSLTLRTDHLWRVWDAWKKTVERYRIFVRLEFRRYVGQHLWDYRGCLLKSLT
jgi:hypothetical protein